MMRTNTHPTTLSTLFKRVALGGLAALALSASGGRLAGAIPPEPIDPPIPPPPVYKPNLIISSYQKSSAN